MPALIDSCFLLHCHLFLFKLSEIPNRFLIEYKYFFLRQLDNKKLDHLIKEKAHNPAVTVTTPFLVPIFYLVKAYHDGKEYILTAKHTGKTVI